LKIIVYFKFFLKMKSVFISLHFFKTNKLIYTQEVNSITSPSVRIPCCLQTFIMEGEQKRVCRTCQKTLPNVRSKLVANKKEFRLNNCSAFFGFVLNRNVHQSFFTRLTRHNRKKVRLSTVLILQRKNYCQL